MTTAVDLRAFVVVTGVGECVRPELAATTEGAPDRVCLLVPGQIVWDDCHCGQFAQTITTTNVSRNPPQPAADMGQCQTPYLVVNVISSIVRCVPTSDDGGGPPTCADLLAAARQLEEDKAAVRRGVTRCLCNLLSTDTVLGFSVGEQTAVGEQGACAGSELAWQFWLPNPDQCCSG
jgi:hypothetical protein